MRFLDMVRSLRERTDAIVILAAMLVCALASSSCLYPGAKNDDCRLVVVDSEGWRSSCVPDAGGSEYLLPPSGVSNTFHSVVGLGERGVAVRVRNDLGQLLREINLPVRMHYYDLASVALSPRQTYVAWLDPVSNNFNVLENDVNRSVAISPDLGINSASIHFMEWVDETTLIVAVYGGDKGAWNRILTYSCETGVTQYHDINFDWLLLRHALSPNRKYVALASRKPNCNQVVSIVDASTLVTVTNVTTTACRDVLSLVWDVDSCGLLYTLGDSLYEIDLSGSERLVYRHNASSQGSLFAECVTRSSVVLKYCSSGNYAQDSCFIFDRKTGAVMPMRADAYSWQAIPGTSKLVYRTGP